MADRETESNGLRLPDGRVRENISCYNARWNLNSPDARPCALRSNRKLHHDIDSLLIDGLTWRSLYPSTYSRPSALKPLAAIPSETNLITTIPPSIHSHCCNTTFWSLVIPIGLVTGGHIYQKEKSDFAY